MPCLRDVLQPLGTHLSPALLPAEAFSRVLAITELLPAELSSGFGFECQLGHKATASASLALHVSPSTGASILSGEDVAPRLARLLLKHAAWRRLRAFGECWADSTSSLHSHILRVQLKFDLRDGTPEGLVPDAFVYFDTTAVASFGTLHRATESALHLLLGAPLPAATSSRVARCLHALPPGARLLHAGVLPSRQAPKVRLCVAGLSRKVLPDYLRGLDWVGNPRSLSNLLSDLEGTVDFFNLSVDIGNEVMPRILLDCHFFPSHHSAGQGRTRALADYLVGRVLCTFEQREALLNWTDESLARFPQPLLESSRMARRVGYFQLAHVPGGALEARAFFGAVQRPPAAWPYRSPQAWSPSSAPASPAQSF